MQRVKRARLLWFQRLLVCIIAATFQRMVRTTFGLLGRVGSPWSKVIGTTWVGGTLADVNLLGAGGLSGVTKGEVRIGMLSWSGAVEVKINGVRRFFNEF